MRSSLRRANLARGGYAPRQVEDDLDGRSAALAGRHWMDPPSSLVTRVRTICNPKPSVYGPQEVPRRRRRWSLSAIRHCRHRRTVGQQPDCSRPSLQAMLDGIGHQFIDHEGKGCGEVAGQFTEYACPLCPHVLRGRGHFGRQAGTAVRSAHRNQRFGSVLGTRFHGRAQW